MENYYYEREKNIRAFLRILFDVGEYSNFSKHDGDTSVAQKQAIDVVDLSCQSVCINPLDSKKDHRIDDPCIHHADLPRRANHNVTVFRNFLIEMDELPLEYQQEYVEKMMMPHSAAVYSGGKSIHYIISLETPLKDLDEYKAVSKRLHSVMKKADHGTKSPTVRVRYPYHYRITKKKEQELKYVRCRIPNNEFFGWLEDHGSYEEEELEIAPEMQGLINCTNQPIGLSGYTNNLLMFGSTEGNRNIAVFMAACDFAKNGIPIEGAKKRIAGCPNLFFGDFTVLEANRAIQSAYNRLQLISEKSY